MSQMKRRICHVCAAMPREYFCGVCDDDREQAAELEFQKDLKQKNFWALIDSQTENRTLRGELEVLHQRLCEAKDALLEVANWPDGGQRYGQDSIKRFASSALTKITSMAGGGGENK